MEICIQTVEITTSTNRIMKQLVHTPVMSSKPAFPKRPIHLMRFPSDSCIRISGLDQTESGSNAEPGG